MVQKVAMAVGVLLLVLVSSLRNLKSLHLLGAVSMTSICVLTICLGICAVTAPTTVAGDHNTAWQLWPQSGSDLLNVLRE